MNSKTGVFLIGFGGPENPSQIRPFLMSVLQGCTIPEERIQAVISHYEMVGGSSPYNAHTEKQRSALQSFLFNSNISVPVYVGYRNSQPSFEDVFEKFKEERVEKIIGFILSSFRSHSSFGKYQEKIEIAKNKTKSSVPIIYTKNFYNHPLFIEAQSLRIEEALKGFRKDETYFLFSAHSISESMAKECRYTDEFKETAELVASKSKLKNWGMAYQSRSGNPKDPWLGPDVKDALAGLKANQFKQVLLVPVGFLCDNVEVIYDLDVEAKEKARTLGLGYLRAKTVMDHPLFIEMMAELITQL